MPSPGTAESARPSRGLGALLLGGVAGQGLTVLVAPLLTRLYAPADFGNFAVVAALVAVLGVLTTLRLEVAVVLPPEDDDAAALAWTAGVCALVVSLVIALAGLVAAAPLGRLLGAPALPGLWWLVVTTALLVGLFQVFSAWLTRRRRYTALGARNFVLGGATAAGQVGLGLLPVGAAGLALGQAAGYLAAAVGTGASGGLFRRRPRVPAARRVLARYRRFPLVSSWSALINSAGQQAPVLVVSAMYGQVVVGLLGLTVRVLAAPAAVIGRAVAPVFLGEAGAGARAGVTSLESQVRRTALALAVIGAVPALALIVAGPTLFDVVFGPEWAEAGVLARVLAVGYLAQFVVSPVSQTLLVLERQGAQLGWDVLRLLLTCGAPLAVAATGAGAPAAVTALSAAQTVAYLALLLFCLRSARARDRSVLVHPSPRS